MRVLAPSGRDATAQFDLIIGGVTLQETTFIGTCTYTAKDFRATAEAMFSGKLGQLDWYKPRPLSGGAKPFSDIRKGAIDATKIILKP